MTTKTTTATKFDLYPILDYVFIKRDDNETVSDGGILIPESAQNKARLGTVLAMGPGKKLENGMIEKPTLRKHDRVMFTSFAGAEIKYKGQDLVVLRECDCMAIIGRDHGGQQ